MGIQDLYELLARVRRCSEETMIWDLPVILYVASRR